MALSTRQPFGEISTPRLQALQSAKNRQNATTPTSPFSSPLKPTPTPSTGKRRASAIFDDTLDSENIDPSLFNSPTKKSKTSSSSNDAGFIKPAKFSLISTPSTYNSPALTASPSIPSVRKSLSSTSSTPISHSRGSPKNKRIGLLSKRRASSSPFRRVDPPSFSTQSSPAGLPFSIDAALSGTIPNYTPKSTVPTPAAAPITPTLNHEATSIEDSMPKGWFFEIHEDTPEQEAANLMEHSASVLDISSDDDFETKQLNEDRGKENVPPPEWAMAQPRTHTAAASSDVMMTGEHNAAPVEQHVKLPRLRKIAQDAMDEDRKPLGDLLTTEFYGEGCDASSYVTVDPGLERPSALSKEFDFSCPSPEKENVEVPVETVVEDVVEAKAVEEEAIQVFTDEPAVAVAVAVAQEEVAPVVAETASASEPEAISNETP
ncbi:hypothetical protein CC80DRAFT_128449 [Byssothecium circinans]|uniref:Uncharacterized protein n=1 Tax=Byssothecium circinans TaxID=147558 RepID=A0A6A5TN41_9PLEO|nr:hypothetical protein CC80DRAFT_128449 [Byssothecium circinans]